MGLVFNGLVANMSRWRQQVPSLASRTWTSVYGNRSGPDAMIAILAIFVLVALVCGWPEVEGPIEDFGLATATSLFPRNNQAAEGAEPDHIQVHPESSMTQAYPVYR